MKRIFALCFCFMAGLCMAQTAPATGAVSVAVTGQATAYHLAGVTHAGTDATEAVAFINSKSLGAFDLEAHQITSADSSLSAYLFGGAWTPNLDGLISKTLLPANAFQVKFRLDPGLVRNAAGKSHLGGVAGGEINYDPSAGSHFSVTLIGVDYLRAQGITPGSANGYRVYGGLSMSIGGSK